MNPFSLTVIRQMCCMSIFLLAMRNTLADNVTLSVIDKNLVIKHNEKEVSKYSLDEYSTPGYIVYSPDHTHFYVDVHKFGGFVSGIGKTVNYVELHGYYKFTDGVYVRHSLKSGRFTIHEVSLILDGPRLQMLVQVRGTNKGIPMWRWTWLKWDDLQGEPTEILQPQDAIIRSFTQQKSQKP